jgi:hypothetical protein
MRESEVRYEREKTSDSRKQSRGGVAYNRLREEQILTFQALLFILFPHPFHERPKLQDRNFNSHKKLRRNNRNSDFRRAVTPFFMVSRDTFLYG